MELFLTSMPKQELEDLILGCVTSCLSAALKHQISSQREDEPLTIDEAAAFLKMSKQTIYEYVSTNRIPYSKPGRSLYFFKSDLIAWLKEHRKATLEELEEEAEASLLEANKRRRNAR